MGSGKGKTRRAQATGAPASASFMVHEWNRFVEEQNLKSVSLAVYYGVDPKSAPLDWQAQMATGFFHDLVELDALELPSGVSVDDFRFKTKRKKATVNSPNDTESLTVFRKERQTELGKAAIRVEHEAHVIWYPSNILNGKTKAGNRRLRDLMQAMSWAVNDTLRPK